VVNSILRGPLVIGEGCSIVDAYIGPFTAIADEVTIECSEIEHSIVLRGSKIRHVDARIESSLIGRDVTIQQGAARPRATRFMVGDSSHIEL
jgi:glucose-1-phosphate thymidylyltransferase